MSTIPSLPSPARRPPPAALRKVHQTLLAAAQLVALRRARLALLAALLIAGLSSVVAPVAAGPAAAAEDGRSALVVTGRGWGHGRGMSQYGALGYATGHGWSSAQILDHYYGGTTAGPAPVPGGPGPMAVDPRHVRVDLVHLRGRSTTVELADGTIHLMASDGSTLRRVVGAVRLTAAGGQMTVATAPSCAGPWSEQPPIDRSLIRIEAETGAEGQSGLLQACGPSYRTWYDGELWATAVGGRQHTINLVSVEEYLRGVVPNEVPAGWPTPALEAQAVAARSYVLAGDSRWTGYADTCDSTLCQVYDGRFTTRAGWRSATHPRTDAAVAATAGLVRLRSTGAVARTEFSSSSGGHTAGGAFPAVADAGDATPSNPNSTWRVTVDLQAIENSYGLGRFTGLVVTQRNGLGADGGRVETVEYRFTDGSVTVSGDRARRQLGLKSNWFSFGPLTRGGVVVNPGPEAIARFVDEAYQRLHGRPPTGEEAERWRRQLENEPRLNLTRQLVHSEYYSGVLVDDLYLAALGRPSDPEGRRYWVDTLAGGLKYEHLGTLFYGSTEYVRRSGDNHDGFVTSLYTNILGRAPDDEGRQYWLGLLRSGQARPADVANAFYRSVESRRDRSAAVHRRVMASEPSGSELAQSAERLLVVDDLTLAAELATALGGGTG